MSPLVQVAAVAGGFTFVLALAAWGFPAVRRGLRAGWRNGRHVVPMCLAALRWPRLAASSGLARWKTFTRPARRSGDGEAPRLARQVEKPVNVPVTKRWRLTPAGFEFVVKHRFGQSIDTYRDAIEPLQSGLRGQVRVLRVYDSRGHLRRDRSRIVVNRRDPFARVPRPLAESATRHRLGVLEDGRDWLLCFRENPHLLVTGETGSGKSGWEAALLASLAPTDAVVVLVDLKYGVSAEPYRARASMVAETVEQAALVLGDLHRLGEARAALCKAHTVDKVYDLPEHLCPREVYVFVDEVAEVAMRGREGKEHSDAAVEGLLRAVQLLRFVGVHVIVCGQRFGSALGKQITSIRAQLPGRVCLRVADTETADMCVGDIATEATHAALEIPQHLPGVAVVKGGPDGWQMARVAHTSHARLAQVAGAHADNRTDWAVVMGEAADPTSTATLPAITTTENTTETTEKESVS